MCRVKSVNQTTDPIEILKKSPMFNLSLSSKELFHSNFLYWLSTLNNGDIFKGMVKVCFGVDGLPDGYEIKREYNNFDLCVVKKENEVNKNKTRIVEKLLLVIENKVKSIPTIEQLQKYDDKIRTKWPKSENVKKILLSLTANDINPYTNENEDNPWVGVGYDRVCDFLENVKINESYEQSLIKDYCLFMRNMIELVGAWKGTIDPKERFLLNYYIRDSKIAEDSNEQDVPDKQGYYNDHYVNAKELRIHDLYGKYRTHLLKDKLQELLKNLYERAEEVGIKLTPQVAYSNEQPILEVMITSDAEKIGELGDKDNKIEPEAFFISLQGNQYRHAINARENITREDIILNSGNSDLPKIPEKWSNAVKSSVLRICNKKEWWWFVDPNVRPDNVEWGGESKIINGTSQRNLLCSFAGRGKVNYIYQYKNIKEDATVDKVLNYLVEDVKNVIKNFKNKQ